MSADFQVGNSSTDTTRRSAIADIELLTLVEWYFDTCKAMGLVDDQQLNEMLFEIEQQIAEIPARSYDGLIAKARVLEALAQEPSDVVSSLVDDLLKFGQPKGKRPEQLTYQEVHKRLGVFFVDHDDQLWTRWRRGTGNCAGFP